MAMAGSNSAAAAGPHAGVNKATHGPGPSPIDSLDVFKYTNPRKPGRTRAATAGGTPLGVSVPEHASTNGFAGHSSTPQPGQLHGQSVHHQHNLHHAHSFSVGTGLAAHGQAQGDAHPTFVSPAAGLLSRSDGLLTQAHQHGNGAPTMGPSLGASARGVSGTPTAQQLGGAEQVVRPGAMRQFTVTEQVLQEHETPQRPMFVIESVARRSTPARQRLPYRVGRFLVHSIVPTPSEGNLPPKRNQAKHNHFRSTQVLRLNKAPRADSANVVIHFSKQGAINVSQAAHGGGGKGQGGKGAGGKGQRRRRARVSAPANTPARANGGGGKQRRRPRKHSGSGSALGVAGGNAGGASGAGAAPGGAAAASGNGSAALQGEDEQEGFDFASIGVTDTDVPDFASVAYSEAGSEAGSEVAVGAGTSEGVQGGDGGEDDVGAQPGDGAHGYRAAPAAVAAAQPRYVYGTPGMVSGGAPAAPAAPGWHPGYAHAMQQLATHAASSNNMLRFLINSLHSAGMLQQASQRQQVNKANPGGQTRAKPSHSSLRLTDELRQQVESLVLAKNDLTKRNRELRKEARDLRAQLEAAEKQQTVLKQQLERARGPGARNGNGVGVAAAGGPGAANGAGGAAVAGAGKDSEPTR